MKFGVSCNYKVRMPLINPDIINHDYIVGTEHSQRKVQIQPPKYTCSNHIDYCTVSPRVINNLSYSLKLWKQFSRNYSLK